MKATVTEAKKGKEKRERTKEEARRERPVHLGNGDARQAEDAVVVGVPIEEVDAVGDLRKLHQQPCTHVRMTGV